MFRVLFRSQCFLCLAIIGVSLAGFQTFGAVGDTLYRNIYFMSDTKQAVLNVKIITVEGSSYTGAKRRPEFCGSDIVIISKGSTLGSLSYLNKVSSLVSPRGLSRRHFIITRSLNLKVSSGIRAGIKYGEYILKTNNMKKMKVTPGNQGV